MSTFISHLAEYLHSELRKALESASGSELRVYLAGLPLSILDELFEALTSDGNDLCVQSAGGPVSIPVFVLDSSAKDPETLCSSRCTSSHLVKVRTSSCSVFLALLPPSELTNLSIDSTMTWIGNRALTEDLDDWLSHPFVERLVSDGLGRFFSECVPETATKALEHSLKEAWYADERYRDHRHVWKILRALFDAGSGSGPDSQVLLAVLGLPSCQIGDIGTSEHLKLLDRVADLLESTGFTAGFELLEGEAGDTLRVHVIELREHILSRCKTANEFASGPSSYYRPIEDALTGNIPGWWHALSLDVWNSLLDGHAEDDPMGGLEVTCNSPLLPPLRGNPIITRSNVEVSVGIAEITGPVEIRIGRASGSKMLEQVGVITVTPDHIQIWRDADVPDHDRWVRYRFEADGYQPVTSKFIVLDRYRPGVVAYSRNATKITQFKLNRNARDRGSKVERYECELNLHGMGTHQLDLYKGSQVSLGDEVICYEASPEQDEPVRQAINVVDDYHAVSIVETDEESYCEFRGSSDSSGTSRTYRIYIQAEDRSPTGATSEFERLVIEHRAAARGEKASARVEVAISRVTDLQVWAMESDDSFQPLILGPDYLQCWRTPIWTERPVFSSLDLMLDPRPPLDEFQPPLPLVEARRRIQSYFNQSDTTNPIEMTRLGELMTDGDFSTSVNEYVKAYAEWLEFDYPNAVWMDVVSLHRSEGRGDALSPIPYAILLTPLHPIRLAWQCQAQQILREALNAHARCPAASVLDPCTFPDCLILPCRSATGRSENQAFLALANTSDYWGVLWNKDRISDLNSIASDDIFGREFGILIDGLATGFSVQQVVRSVEEVERLSSAKSTLRISVASDTTGSSSCNDGIAQWGAASLGVDGDQWHSAGPKSLHVYDRRSELLHPEQSALASLTSLTGAAVRWFTQSRDTSGKAADLAIIAHLGILSPSFQIENLRSAIDVTGLTRWRIRKQLSPNGGVFIAEARVGKIPPTDDPEGLQSLLLRCADRLEGSCSAIFDSYVFAPKMPTLEEALSYARYCAVSSSSIDAACFFRGTQDSYLWDYELPSYSRRAGENNGYYLLAKESPSMVKAVQSAVEKMVPTVEFPAEYVQPLLREISRRGMPTLKRLTGGGTMTLGEIGMLVALRILQSEFEDNTSARGLIPVRMADDILNLVVPADPFRNQFDDLRTAIQSRTGERPDVLILSIRFLEGRPVKAKITPLEVKARSLQMPQADQQAALHQASSFSDFLEEMRLRSSKHAIWGIAWRSMIASWLDYAFRVYGQLDSFLHQGEWAELHASVLSALITGELDIEIDKRGRLIVVDATNASSPRDVDGDRFRESIVISHADAYTILGSHGADLRDSIGGILDGWDMIPGEDIASPHVDEQQRDESSRSPSGCVEGETQEPTSNDEQPTCVDVEPDELSPSGIEFEIGRTIDAFTGRELYFRPGNTALNQLNVGIVGDLGTGKTQLVQSLIYQIRSHPEKNRGRSPRVLIFDYKKDYTKEQFVRATGARVVTPYDIPLNLFDIRTCGANRNPWLERNRFFVDVLTKLYGGIGPTQRERIKQAVRDSYDQAEHAGQSAPTIYDVFAAYAARANGAIDTPYSIMSDMVDGGYFVRRAQDVQSFDEFLDGVVVVDLGALGQDDRTKNTLVVVMLNLFYEHMLSVQKQPFIGRDPQYRFVDTILLVDEADNIMRYEFDVLKKVLLQGREFGAGVILASQYLSHFKTQNEDYLQPLLTWFIHKVPNITVGELQRVGLTHVDSGIVERIKTLARHECLYKTCDVGGQFMRAEPFYEVLERSES